MEFFYCYAYGRLSKEDGDKIESDSIKNQRDLIHSYIGQRPELKLVMEGYDDGYTGTNFERPHFKEMLEAVKEQRVNCVIVKDLSRFGREYIEAGRYIEKLFPALGVRFIAINDNYDTAHLDASSSLILPFKNLINDSYSRDTSIKTRSHFDVKRRNGDFIGSFAAYGYAKDPENKNKLVVDPEAADVVREIFARRIAGMSCQGIADELNALGVLSPMEYKRSKGMNYKSGYRVHNKTKWAATAVRRILQNEVYLGVMEQGKRTTPNYKVKTVIHRPPEEWMRVEGVHEAIVSQEDFELAARLMRTDTRTAPGKKAVHPFAGIICCGDCRGGMVRKTTYYDGKTYHYYACATHRADNGICSPHISGRARLFEVVQRVKEVNAERQRKAPGRRLTGSSSHDPDLKAHPELALDYIVAPPRMAHYIQYSTRIFEVYLKYIAPEDIHSYSIDEVMMDVTNYLDTYKMNARELARTILLDVLHTTGITAAAGIGSNLYLAKVAMDIVAKHIHADEYGVRIAKLTEKSYRRLLWSHRPLTDFWRVGRGYAKKLEEHGLYTMGDIARCSIGKPTDYYNEDLLYKLFGVNAELLVDHAWGWEPVTIADVKAYKPESSSIGAGQVLQSPYPFDKARLVAREMADSLSLDLVDKGLMTDQIVLTVGYDRENLTDPQRSRAYKGPVTTDSYGRKIPKHAHGTANLGRYSSSTSEIVKAAMELFDRIVDKDLLVRRLNIVAGRVLAEDAVPKQEAMEQLDLFTDYEAREKQQEADAAALEREKKVQRAMLDIKKKYGKNAILKGMNLQEGATARERNRTIGGHQE